MTNNKCKECGCSCKKCFTSDHDVQLHIEIENLKQRLVEKENHIVMMETNFLNEANKYPSGEMAALKDELLTWQDKYKRLYEAHRRVQRVNQGLEDKLLKLVDICETDKNTLTRDVATLSHNLADANYAIKKLTQDNERYRNDVNLAIQFLQCKQTNFVAHRFDSLPNEVQAQVAVYMNNKRKPVEEKTRPSIEPKSIKVPIPTFPPTAMVYSVPKSPKLSERHLPENELEQPQVDIVSAAIMAKVLEERQKERALAKHCDTCNCAKNLKIIYEITHHHVGTQTGNEYKENVCLKCNDLLASTLSTGLQILKSVDEKTKRTSPYPSLVPVETMQNNIVKVQPNNFLIEKAKSHSNASLAKELQNNLQDQVGNGISSAATDLIDFSNEVTVMAINEKASVHHLMYQDSEKLSSRPTELGVKGPRYASMRLQSGSKNILLDNAHTNIAPVLYTRNQQEGDKKSAKPNLLRQLRRCDPKVPQASRQDSSSISSSSSKQISLVSENSTQHQQRINDWVQVTVENENISSSDNSRTEDVKVNRKKEMEIKVEKVRYAEMEENVKRFLFGESDFWKTVEIGKLKYKSYQEVKKNKSGRSRNGSRTSSHTETEI